MTLGTGASMENKKTVESTDATPSMVADRAATAEDAATMIRTWHAEVVILWHLQSADE